MLGRCRRRSSLCDRGEPRNAAVARAPRISDARRHRAARLQRLGRRELMPYGIEFRHVARHRIAKRDRDGFAVHADGRPAGTLAISAARHRRRRPAARDSRYRRVLRTPVFHCPYCDGWEWRDKRARGASVEARGPARALAEDLERRTSSSAQTASTARPRRIADGSTQRHRAARRQPSPGSSTTTGAARIDFADGDRLPCDAHLLLHRPVSAGLWPSGSAAPSRARAP